MGISEIRRGRLRKLIDERFDGVTLRLATALEMKPPQLHRWLSGGQGIREDSARKIEERLQLGQGWLDGIEHTVSYAHPPALFELYQLKTGQATLTPCSGDS